MQRLGIRSLVEPVSGRTGVLSPPRDPRVLGWWQEGRDAGSAAGSAVVIGHTVSSGGGAFDDLGQLLPGDTMRLRTNAGWITYGVTDSRTYTVAGLAKGSEEIFRRTGTGRLVLVTCTDFDGESYLGRTVVYATPILDEPNPANQ